jgi:methionyl-tRNA synthetase
MRSFYVTTPIYYANDKPHVGHAYTTVAADVLARYWRQKLGQDQVFFLTGTDEHGQKIAEAAEKAGLTPHAFVNSLVPRFEETWQALNISNDIFMRTTKPEHLKFAQEFLKELYANGAIYKGEYVGFYCVGCEEYKTETQLIDSAATGGAGGKICPLHPNMTPEQRKEENYFFKFKDYASKVRELITSGALEVLPVERKNEVLSRSDGELHDLSISRPGLSWGIPIPWDETQTMYVWVEALLNYASALEIAELPSFWPPKVQLMAKDILWFHAAIWPALLLAGNRETPKTVFAHGFFTIDGQKMSKTLGNVIDPNELVEQYGTDATRYFLLSAVPFGSDGDLAASRFAEVYQSDLANGLGNLLNRTVTLMGRAEISPNSNSAAQIEGVSEAIEQLKLDLGLKLIWEAIKAGNQYLESRKPWELVKDP